MTFYKVMAQQIELVSVIELGREPSWEFSVLEGLSIIF